MIELDSREEERERQERRARRLERMRAEQLRQKKRRQRLKIIVPAATGVLLVVVVLAAVLAAKHRQVEEPVVEEVIETVVVEEIPEIPEEEPEELESLPVIEEPAPVYDFVSTEETRGINSEAVISSYAILVDESTNTIVAQKAAFDRISPASMTKVLTVLVAAEQIAKEKDLQQALDDTFTMTLEITDYAYVNDCSSVGFLNEENVTVRDLFYGTILPSGADAAVGLACYAAGSHETFVNLMNEKLKELGLDDTAHFTNCVGLYDAEHYCTVYDMAVIMKAAMANEWCREVLSARTYTTTATTQHPEGITISNWFLRRIEDKDTGGEVMGGKTGFVVQSKNCAVSYGIFGDGTPYICATAGSSSSWKCIYDHVEIYSKYVPDGAEE